MKIKSVISKSIREQLRSYWMLLLNLSMGPFFIFVYYLIIESSQPVYNIRILNQDEGITTGNEQMNFGSELKIYFSGTLKDTSNLPFQIQEVATRDSALDLIKSKKADALVIIPDSFSRLLQQRITSGEATPPALEFVGDLTNTRYLISAVWANEIVRSYTNRITKTPHSVAVTETALGTSGNISDFDLVVPGILIISIIMLMFTASIAFVSEVEHKTIMRLKLSRLTIFEFLGGITVVQLLVGVSSVLLTLVTAILLGFDYQGSVAVMIFIASLTSLSIISFSLIIAAATRSANEVLVVGNIPMFLFMFFTGAAFPLRSEAWFHIAGYPVNIQALLSPAHAISALQKTLVMDMRISQVIPEITAILILTVLYFFIGGLLYRKRHLRLN